MGAGYNKWSRRVTATRQRHPRPAHPHAAGSDGLHARRLPQRDAGGVQPAQRAALRPDHARPGPGHVRGLGQARSASVADSPDTYRDSPAAGLRQRRPHHLGRDAVRHRRSRPVDRAGPPQGRGLVDRRPDQRGRPDREGPADLPRRRRLHRRHPPGRGDADRSGRPRTRMVKAGDVLTLKLAPSGGAAVRLTPAR